MSNTTPIEATSRSSRFFGTFLIGDAAEITARTTRMILPQPDMQVTVNVYDRTGQVLPTIYMSKDQARALRDVLAAVLASEGDEPEAAK